MDVPFVSSGAINRRHYTLVRTVESALSAQQIDQALVVEMKSIQQDFAFPSQRLKEIKEHLIILLYCSMTVTTGFLRQGSFDFAFSHALHLAEAGRTVEEKRIGYLFCAEIMPTGHELQLMLINTLRKDLESSNLSRICVALDSVILSPNEEAIPAIHSRLHDLLSHNYPPIRRRAITAFRSLSRLQPDILTTVANKLIKQIKDPQSSVSNAALITVSMLDGLASQKVGDATVASQIKVQINELFHASFDTYGRPTHGFLRILSSLSIVGLTEANLSFIFDLVRFSMRTKDSATILGAFRCLRRMPTQDLLSAEKSQKVSCIGIIRDLLSSREPNEHYAFLSSVACVDPVIWAGIESDHPAILEVWEVERFMQFLDSPDGLLRKLALQILFKVDQTIIVTHYAQVLSVSSSAQLISARNELVRRLLEIVDIISAEDGEKYAREVKHLLKHLEDTSTAESRTVLDSAVDMIITHIRSSEESFKVACVSTLLTFLSESEEHFGPTLTVVISALATEYSGTLSLPPHAILRGLDWQLRLSDPVVQDAAVIAMIRVMADCQEVTPEIIANIGEIEKTSGRHIKRRCKQFLTLHNQREALHKILRNARSSSLPDFVQALQSYQDEVPIPAETSPSATASPKTLPSNKLRYEAYETPQPLPSIRGRRAPSSPYSGLSIQTGVQPGILENSTITTESREPGAMFNQFKAEGDIPLRIDLISLGSPFISDAAEENQAELFGGNFETCWEKLSEHNAVRGWCGTSVADTVRRLQELPDHRVRVIDAESIPYAGEVKVVINRVSVDDDMAQSCILRLKDSEEESCLWRLRCEDAELRSRIKRLLIDE